ncbi:Asp23/Gls24 family envelope stress response protein [Actinomadura macrotermitis]|uniref:Asp23/Gls24 family envelope stress response protein n=1 Tax=Actinomadura macrotermitis TaxID=2585200 RepID=A0A7K0C8I4_9ACTN|nr:Asp23/Gls24 family envelope stress response protein [Actinomadura macrotermitis]MQY09755.1 hypothetical protein [Actinomadura macrotermitis]
MTDLGKGHPDGGGQDPYSEGRSMPFFPGPPGGPPLAAPTAAPPVPPAPGLAFGGTASATDPPGLINIEDEVVEKIAVLAALEVAGVAGLGGRRADGAGPAGAARPDRPGVRVLLRDDEVTLDLLVAVEYGSVIMEVARNVRANVTRVAGLMLGRRVAAVNVTVEDVRLPGA